jgi:pimeloyl-ACP methyl ester carboxylesterase
MAQDSAAALDYLTLTRHIPASQIIPYGAGLGASLAADLALAHPELPALILANPDPDPTATALAAHSSNLIPVRLLFHQRFPISAPLATLTTPKLLIAGGPSSSAQQTLPIESLFQQAASPKFTITLPPTNYAAPYNSALTRFLDQSLPK